jgi:hypothetical protein
MKTYKEMLNIYFQFLISALEGRNVDAFFRENEESIITMANSFNNDFKEELNVLFPKEQIIYRGIILEENKELSLEPVSHIEYISFSTDKKIANEFADLSHGMAEFFKKMRPLNTHGYIIESNLVDEVILFHWRWLDIFLEDLFPQLKKYFTKEHVAMVKKQKEVMVKQQHKKYNLIPFVKEVKKKNPQLHQHYKWDCTVTSIAMMTDIPYKKVLRVCKKVSSNVHEGLSSVEELQVLNLLGFPSVVLDHCVDEIQGLLTVDSLNESDGLHCVYFDGTFLIDPNYEVEGKNYYPRLPFKYLPEGSTMTITKKDYIKYKDKIKGGRGDKKSPSDFAKDAIAKGTQIEMEHTDDPMLSVEIAVDHLSEFPEYYEELEKMEAKMKMQTEQNPSESFEKKIKRLIKEKKDKTNTTKLKSTIVGYTKEGKAIIGLRGNPVERKDVRMTLKNLKKDIFDQGFDLASFFFHQRTKLEESEIPSLARAFLVSYQAEEEGFYTPHDAIYFEDVKSFIAESELSLGLVNETSLSYHFVKIKDENKKGTFIIPIIVYNVAETSIIFCAFGFIKE